jgi:hypothetical protein
MATSFSGGGSRSTWREPPILGKQLVNFITFESSAPFFVIYKAGREPVLVIGLYEVLDAAILLIEPYNFFFQYKL